MKKAQSLQEGIIKGNIKSIKGTKQAPPPPQLSRTMGEGVVYFCKDCGGTMAGGGFLGLAGKRLCNNKNCPNSKLKT